MSDKNQKAQRSLKALTIFYVDMAFDSTLEHIMKYYKTRLVPDTLGA